ncbi:MAG: hypothetical protein JWO82_3981 [Akkermansiaceae bacterium]|nr:hypothetical protein [Akkermansiaceae bacterium]
MKFDSTYRGEFTGDIAVRCPKCQSHGRLFPGPERGNVFASYRMVCGACGHNREWLPDAKTGGLSCPGTGPDLRGFGLSLWFQTPCHGEILWAYNLAHIDFLETFIGAFLRERRRDEKTGWANSSLQSRLPPWMLKAGNRTDVLAGLQRLREMSAESGRP